MIKVANIIEEGRYGGPQARIVDVATALKGDVETTVIMPSKESGRFKDRCKTVAVSYEAFSITRISRNWKALILYFLLSPIEIISLARYLRREKFDLVHVSGGSWQYKGVIAGKLARIKVLWHINDTYMPRIIRFAFSVLHRLSSGFVFASERSRSYYRPLLRSPKYEILIPAPVATKSFDPAINLIGDEEVLKRLGDRLVIGTVANINPIKGLETFIRAAAVLNRSFDNITFVVIGAIYPAQKRYYESLRKLCKELQVSNIDFVGSRTDVRPLVKRFDAYVCSSNSESSPISVWEAMAMGKPVVSTDVGDVPIYVKSKINGFIVNVGDSDAMAMNLKRLIGDRLLRKKFGKKSRDVAVKDLDISKCAERHLEAYNAILAR